MSIATLYTLTCMGGHICLTMKLNLRYRILEFLQLEDSCNDKTFKREQFHGLVCNHIAIGMF